MNKKVNILLLLSFLSIVILGTSYAYSKYRTDVSGDLSASIANWNISVNGCNIVDENSDSNNCFQTEVDPDSGVVNIIRNFGISDISYSNNGSQTIVDNKIGPGSKGNFKIKIKPNDTGVSIKYKLKAVVGPENPAIKLYRSNPNDNEVSNRVPMEVDGYENIITYSPTNINYEEVITIYVDWENDVTGASDEYDTNIGTSGSRPILSIPVSIEFEQYKG